MAYKTFIIPYMHSRAVINRLLQIAEFYPNNVEFPRVHIKINNLFKTHASDAKFRYFLDEFFPQIIGCPL